MPFDENDNSDKTSKERLLGYNFKTDITIPVSDQTNEMIRGAIFPSKYEIPSEYITPVKTQYIGNCWAFAATTMMETYLLLNKLTDKNKPNDNTFSETHMTYSVFDVKDKNDPHTANPGGLTPLPPTSASQTYDYGASRVDVSSYMSKRQNTILEVIDSNFLTKNLIQLPKRDHNISLLKYKQFLVKGIYLIEDPVIPYDPSFISRIKYSLMRYGVVAMGIGWNDIYKQETQFPDYINTLSYYRNLTDADEKAKQIYNTGGHAIAVVGWDDGFPITKFLSPPKKTGAFKVKNSWGTGKGLGDGYIWISYENIGMSNAYCITEMEDDINDDPTGIYNHCEFGMTQYYPLHLGAQQVTFEDTFTVAEDNERITGIGLYNVTPCFATVTLIVGKTITNLISKSYLPHPGYRILDAIVISLGKKNTKFKINVVYNHINFTGVYVPLEYKYPSGYNNLDLNNVSGFIKLEQSGINTSIKSINKTFGTKYGNLALHVITKGTGEVATNNNLAYKELTMPPPNNEGRIDNLPTTIKPIGATADVAIDWKVEPYNFISYNSPYHSPFKIYKVTNASGIINTSKKAESIYITAVIGTSKYSMKKLFKADVPPKTDKSYDFSVSEVTDTNKVDLSGEFSVCNATVSITCNNVTKTAVTDSNGKWNYPMFPLYEITSTEGWKDSYVDSIITVELKDNSGVLLTKGTSSIKLTRPYEVDHTKAIVIISIVALPAFLAGIYHAASAGYTACIASNGLIELPLETMQEARFMNTRNLRIHGHQNYRPTLRFTMKTLFNKIFGIRNINVDFVHTKIDSTDLNVDHWTDPKKFAVIATEITKGGYVDNCNITMDISRVDNMGGIFYEGEDVTVTNCKVVGKVIGTQSCGLIAHTMTGKSIIENCSVNGEIVSNSIGGMVVNSSGMIKNTEVNIKASAQDAVSAVCLNSAGTEISQMLIQGSYSASANNAKASGIVNNMNGGSISDCRISANINTSSKSDDNCAAGIACIMSGNPSIKNCITAGSLSSGETGSALGIATGISGTPSSISNCVSVYPVIHGKNVRRISTQTSFECIAYDGTQCDSGTSFTLSGEQLKSATEILAQKTFSSLNFDFNNKWLFVPKKDFPVLKQFAPILYDYPFLNPYPTQSGEYKIPKNTPFVLLGAMTISASNILWRNLSPVNGWLKSGEPTFKVLRELDEFYMDLKLSFNKVGKYTLEITSVVDNVTFSMPITIEVV